MTFEKNPPLPVVTWENLLPPFTDYDYFDGARRFPFDHQATGISLVNAWWLAETAALVYADEDFVGRHLDRAGFGTLKHFCGNNTDCFVASNDRAALVAFRGTELRPRNKGKDFRPVLANIVTDVNLRLIPSGRCGRVHSGFQTALNEIWDELLDYMRALHLSGLPLWATGHSLGAALATLAADRFKSIRALYSRRKDKK